MPSKIEQIRYSGMGAQESLSLADRLKLPHPPLPDPRRLVRLLCPIIFILLSAVDRLRDQFTMGNSVASQLIRHDLSELPSM